MLGRKIRANTRVATSIVTDPDPFALQAASLGVMTNTFSPGAVGVHSPGASAKGFVGDRGYGVNRWSGRTTYPLQHWAGAIKPIQDPTAQRLGLGAGVAGQPGLPSTGDQTAGLTSLAWMSWSPLGRAGLG
jgi:hypothetical protein